jgi:hypothetical protein
MEQSWKLPPQVRERAVRPVPEHQAEHEPRRGDVPGRRQDRLPGGDVAQMGAPDGTGPRATGRPVVTVSGSMNRGGRTASKLPRSVRLARRDHPDAGLPVCGVEGRQAFLPSVRHVHTLLALRAATKAGTRPALAHAAARRAG